MQKEKNNNRKKRLLAVFFVLFCMGITLWTALNEFAGGKDAEKFENVKIHWIFILPAAGCFLLAIGAEIFKWYTAMRETGKKGNFKTAANAFLMGRYYDNVTPSGVGGQPYQIYHLNQNGFDSAESSAITMACFISMQFAFIIIALICFTAGFSVRMKYDAVFRISGYIGLVLFSSVPIAILIFAFLPRAASRIINFFVKLLHKMRFIKNVDEKVQKVENIMEKYSGHLRATVKKPVFCFKIMLLSLLFQCARCSIPFFVILAFGGKVNYLSSFVTTVSIYMAITYIPTPGNSGVAEGSFYAMFSDLTNGYIFWAMLTWRFFTFYSYILYGLFFYIKKTIDG